MLDAITAELQHLGNLIYGQFHCTELPMTDTLRVEGDIWRSNGEDEKQRTLAVTTCKTISYRYWLHGPVHEQLKRQLDDLTHAVLSNAKVTAELTNLPPCFPGAGHPVASPPDAAADWVFGRLLAPLVARAVFLRATLPPDLPGIVVQGYRSWLEGGMKSFAVATLEGFRGPATLTVDFDDEVQLRPITKEDVQAFLYAEHPLMASWVPRDFLAPTHVIEYRPQAVGYALEERYDRGVIRALTALRLLRQSKTSCPTGAAFSDGPSRMLAGAASPMLRAPWGLAPDLLAWQENDHKEVRDLYSALGRVAPTDPLSVTLHWWDRSHGEERYTNALLAAWIALESFYGIGLGSQELQNRIGLRCALYISDAQWNFAKCYGDVVVSYKARSKIVHQGAAIKKQSEVEKLVTHWQTAANALHRTLRRALLNPPRWSMEDAEQVLAQSVRLEPSQP